MMTAGFKFEILKDRKIMVIYVEGFFKEEDAGAFLAEYKSKLATINPEEYNLILDGKKLKVSAQEMVPILEGILKMYIEDKFNKIYLVEIDSPTAMMQLKKIGQSFFLDKVVIAESTEKALKLA